MRTGSRVYRGLAALAAGFALLAPAGALAAGRPAGMSPQEYRAMMIRGQALNQMYGLDVPAGMTAQQWKAMLARGEGMNALFVPTKAATPAPVTPVATVSAGGFDWTDAGIGAAVVAGIVLLGTGVTVGARHNGRWHPHPRVS